MGEVEDPAGGERGSRRLQVGERNGEGGIAGGDYAPIEEDRGGVGSAIHGHENAAIGFPGIGKGCGRFEQAGRQGSRHRQAIAWAGGRRYVGSTMVMVVQIPTCR